jgi:hypothetical protein
MRSAGVNLNKLWLNLLVLRNNVANLFSSDASTSGVQPSVWVPLTFPDPLPAPQSAMQNMRSLRHVQTVEDVNVVHTAQMIPVLISLIHSVLETANIREEIDQGIRDARDIARDAKEAIKIENERWEKEKEKEQNDVDDVSKIKVEKNEVNISILYLLATGFHVYQKNIGQSPKEGTQGPNFRYQQCRETHNPRFYTPIFNFGHGSRWSDLLCALPRSSRARSWFRIP